MTEQPPAVPLPGPNVTPEPNEKIKDLAINSTVPGAETKPQYTPFESGTHPWHCVTERPPAVPLPGPNVTPEPNEKIKVLAGNSTVPGAKSKPEDSLRIRKTPWHGMTEQPPPVPLPGPNLTPEPNEKSKVLASNSTVPRRRKRARRHPSNQENTLARREGTASCRPFAGPNVTPEPNEKIKVLGGNSTVLKHRKQPSNQENTLASRRNSLLPSLCPGQTSLLNRMKKSRFWQAIHCSKAQKASQKTPFESGKHPGTA